MPAAKTRQSEPSLRLRTKRGTGATLSVDIGGGWTASYEIAKRNGQLVVEELRVSSIESPPSGLTSTALRRVLVGEHLALARRELARLAGEGERARARGPRPSSAPPGPLRPTSDMLPAAALFRLENSDLSREVLDEPRHPGRKGRDPAFYAIVAAHYIAALQSGSRRPVRDVAERLSAEGEFFAPSYVRDLIQRARDLRLLTTTERGRAGGVLTDRARELLGRPVGSSAQPMPMPTTGPLPGARRPPRRRS